MFEERKTDESTRLKKSTCTNQLNNQELSQLHVHRRWCIGIYLIRAIYIYIYILYIINLKIGDIDI